MLTTRDGVDDQVIEGLGQVIWDEALELAKGFLVCWVVAARDNTTHSVSEGGNQVPLAVVLDLHDAIADDYPKLRATIGEDAFHALMSGYLRAHPPRSFTLRDAGLALPEFLRTWSSAPAWAPELAALERARVEVFDGPDATPLTQDEVMALDAALPELVLRWVPSSVVVPLTS